MIPIFSLKKKQTRNHKIDSFVHIRMRVQNFSAIDVSSKQRASFQINFVHANQK